LGVLLVLDGFEIELEPEGARVEELPADEEI
jgi:hypothetical protein